MRCAWAPGTSPPGITPGCARREGRFELLRAADASKDQSYFLHRLTQAQLSRVLFPLAHLRKTEVRELAAAAGLGNHAKKDSTGICFIGERPFRQFLNRYLPKKPGAMLDAGGRVVGEHMGLMFYTLGQRKGIGLGGSRSGSGEPWFVAAKDVARNTITVVQGHDHPLLRTTWLEAADASWVAGAPPPAGNYGAKTRYRQSDSACRLTTGEGGRFRLDFEAPQWAVTPGQSAVLYDGAVCLGGGIIDAAGN